MKIMKIKKSRKKKRNDHTKTKKTIPAIRINTKLMMKIGHNLAIDVNMSSTCSEMLGFGVNKIIPGCEIIET